MRLTNPSNASGLQRVASSEKSRAAVFGKASGKGTAEIVHENAPTLILIGAGITVSR